MNKDAKILDKRLQMYIANMALGYLPFGRKWDSSAKKLEQGLLLRGIKLPQKLYYEYKLPGNITPSDFMNKLIIESFVNDFYSWFAGKILKDKNLTMKDKANIFKYVWNNRKKYKNILQQYDQEIRKLNPELANIKVDNPRSLVYGAMFGFAPAEITYFSNGKNRDLAKERETMDLLKNRFGIDVTYILAPETAEQIINALKQNEQFKAKER